MRDFIEHSLCLGAVVAVALCSACAATPVRAQGMESSVVAAAGHTIVYRQSKGDKWTIKMTGPRRGQIIEDDIDITTAVSPCRGVSDEFECVDIGWLFFAVPRSIELGDSWEVNDFEYWVVDKTENEIFYIISRGLKSPHRISHFRYKRGVGLIEIMFSFKSGDDELKMDEPFFLESDVGLIP